MNDTLHFLGISGSLRRQSRNTGLLRCAARSLPEGVSMDIADISDLPLYNEDMEKPASAARLIDQIRRADALVLACPEYNYSWAPALKNARAGQQGVGGQTRGHPGRGRRHGHLAFPIPCAPELCVL